ncbi:Nucleoside-diphosphate-sugar epimerase [Persephonella hydrogeniphila]|uniref:Nucleoside-diphosphate-sugar epimerase n=1 Tax=Persephonella hydrogeniphila TaxID=198703 RepID=A0A285NLL6_9AQUI|nr:SDR family NAD(P)-dependent oxidoreductase [Persephonella hydrogeniphila]SNZ10392.1 Nucleoside-diphosphate-sugar epimerase [Persephonella hydrogeniphila]
MQAKGTQTVLVTGAAGFIGWKTAKLLLESGFNVIGIDNMNHYYDVKLKEWRKKDLEKYENFRFFQIDIQNLGALKVLFDSYNFDAVLNLAARAGVRYSMENPHVYLQTNAQGTLNLLEMMKEKDIKKMVLASTSSLYAGQPMPFKETLPVNTPISPYAASKKAAEVMAYTYHYLYNMDITVVRYFTVYGPAGRPDMSIFRFIKWIDEGTPIRLFGDGSQARDFTYVDDIARGTVLAMKPLGYEIINLGGGKNPISLKAIIQKIEDLLGKKAKIEYKPFHKADMKETWADIEKAESLLGWKPEINIDEGLKRTVQWYLQNKEWLKDVSVEEGKENI